MSRFWRFLAIISLILCIVLGFLLYRQKSDSIDPNAIRLTDIDKDDFEYRKKQNGQYAPDLNDYFYKSPTDIRFINDLYDFDTIKQGTKLSKRIEYLNIGKNPFFITDLKVSCGCTAPSYNKEPVSPGDTGYIEIIYDSKGKEGFSMNRLAVYGNVLKGEKSVYFKVYVTK